MKGFTGNVIKFREDSGREDTLNLMTLLHRNDKGRFFGMMVSTRGRYALRVMIDLAAQNRESYIPLRDIAQRQEISEKYLESIVKVLTKEGLLEGLRGKGGGYRMTKPAEEYTVYDILKLSEGSLAPVSCLECEGGSKKCSRAADCPTLPMWKELDTMIKDFFSGITIADLLKNHRAGDDYII